MSKRVFLGVIKTGDLLGNYWQINFAEMPHKEGCKYILVLVGTFSGWPEAYLCYNNTAREAVKALLNHIILKFGVPLGMSSDKDHIFVAMVVGQVSSSRILGLIWELHTPYRPQASVKV